MKNSNKVNNAESGLDSDLSQNLISDGDLQLDVVKTVEKGKKHPWRTYGNPISKQWSSDNEINKRMQENEASEAKQKSNNK